MSRTFSHPGKAVGTLVGLLALVAVLWLWGADAWTSWRSGVEEVSSTQAPGQSAEELAQGRVLINGREMSVDEPAYVIDGVVMLPMRAVFEAANAEVTYQPYQKKGIATSDGVKVAVVGGYQHALIDGKTFEMTRPSMIIRGSLYVPLNLVEQVVTLESPSFTLRDDVASVETDSL